MPERKLGEPVFGVLPIQVLVDTCCRSKVGFRRLLPITGQSAVGPKPAGLVEQYLPFNKAPNIGRSSDYARSWKQSSFRQSVDSAFDAGCAGLAGRGGSSSCWSPTP